MDSPKKKGQHILTKFHVASTLHRLPVNDWMNPHTSVATASVPILQERTLRSEKPRKCPIHMAIKRQIENSKSGYWHQKLCSQLQHSQKVISTPESKTCTYVAPGWNRKLRDNFWYIEIRVQSMASCGGSEGDTWHHLRGGPHAHLVPTPPTLYLGCWSMWHNMAEVIVCHSKIRL